MFYDKDIEIWNIGEGYKDQDGIYHEGGLQYYKTVKVDVQPYSTERLKKDYGYEIDVNKRIFMDLDDNIQIDTIIKYKGNSMEVKKYLEWDDYMEVFCLEEI